ncbi:aspartic proteinase 39 isoform X2 [Manihot esculenta]|uniref:Uncharacterized protein n=1 Tax=Manihot esculenta TaxID=3983 RepID=A0ACB7GY42_MANES|nr:aspartic proteinase 39 isoform X2 [Manihot esculenta]KAG8644690.1 hypothetical protein MANES_11G154800v8 [Manihot esculenta]
MAVAFPAGIVIAALLLPVSLVFSSFPATLTLERGIPPSHRLELNQLRMRDGFRHRRILQSAGGVVDFPVQGTFNPFLVGLYYTKVQLGSPPKDFYVQIDTGSDVLWVSCSSCNGCPVTSGLQIPLNFFDPGSSSTASLVSCSDQRCTVGIQSSDSLCASQSNQCGYTFQYGDGSGTSGYYVADLLHFDTVLGGSVTNNSSASVVFGPHYNLNLQSISVNGQTLAIDPSVFVTSSNQGTIVDSGTTLAYLAEAAYDPFVNAITSIASQNARTYLSKGNQCYLVTTSINDVFPKVSFNFGGAASMILNPQDYLLQQNSVGGAAVWCIGFQKTPGQEITILGDLVLKDKIFVYDIANQRLGWTNYDCSMSVNVSTTTNTGKSEFVDAGQISNNSSPKNVPQKLILITLLQVFILGIGGHLFL